MAARGGGSRGIPRWNSAERGGRRERKRRTDDPTFAAPLLSCDEEFRLFTEYRRTRDPHLRERLILANTRLVRAVASNYSPRDAMEDEDIEQEGMIGLMRAVERFEPERGLRFSSMATYWIRQAIARAFDDKAQAIRLPWHRQTANRMARRRGEPPPTATFQMVSLDLPKFPDDPESGSWGENLPDETQDAVVVEEAATAAAFYAETLGVALARLSAREQLVLGLRFGLGAAHGGAGGGGQTLQEVGAKLGVTRERIRQIESKAIRAVRLALQQDATGEVTLRSQAAIDLMNAERRLEIAATRRETIAHATGNPGAQTSGAPCADRPVRKD